MNNLENMLEPLAAALRVSSSPRAGPPLLIVPPHVPFGGQPGTTVAVP